MDRSNLELVAMLFSKNVHLLSNTPQQKYGVVFTELIYVLRAIALIVPETQYHNQMLEDQ
jgi:hypothetical protein